MKHWKRILAITVSLGLALALLPLSITVANGTVTVGISAPAEVSPGSSFVADVTVDFVTDFDSCGFDVTYDETIISVTDVTGGEIDGHTIEGGPGYWSFIPYGDEDTGRVRVIATTPAAPAPGVTGTGYLAQIHFDVIGSGAASDITLEGVTMYDWEANLISTTTQGCSVQVSQATEPTIAYSPNRFPFSATPGGANPASQILEIWNSGPGTLDWSVTDNAAWLALAPTSGSSSGEHDQVTASVDIGGMSAGDYSATITIAAAGATNTPRTLAVGLTITEMEGPTIGFDPASLSFSAVAGKANPADKTLEIWNSGTGALDWSVSDDAAWLALAPASGSSSGEQDGVTVSIDIAGMSIGDYSATITIAAAGATNTPRTISVSLTLTETEAPTIGLYPASLGFSAAAGQANPANKTLEIWNSGTGTLDWSVSDDAVWLTLAPIIGSSAGEQDVVTVAASVDTTGMTAGSYPATITITAAGATNTPRTASVSLQISEGTNGTAKSVATATGTGTAFFVPSQGVIGQLASVDEASVPEEGKPDLEFAQGLFSFNIVGTAPGDEVEVQITLPDSLPADIQYWSYYSNEWHQIPMAIEPGDDRVMTITLVDGGLGDGDGTADGTISDPGGPGYPSSVDDGAHPLSKGAIVVISIVAGAAIIAGILLLVRRRGSAVR